MDRAIPRGQFQTADPLGDMLGRRWLPAAVAKNCTHSPIPHGTRIVKQRDTLRNQTGGNKRRPPRCSRPRALCRPASEAIKRGALSWRSKRPSWTVARQGCFTGCGGAQPSPRDCFPFVVYLPNMQKKSQRECPFKRTKKKGWQANFRGPTRGLILRPSVNAILPRLRATSPGDTTSAPG